MALDLLDKVPDFTTPIEVLEAEGEIGAVGFSPYNEGLYGANDEVWGEYRGE